MASISIMRAIVSMPPATTVRWSISTPAPAFFNPATGRVHVAIGEPGLVETIDPNTGARVRTMTGKGAHTTAIVVPDRLYVISPTHGGALVLVDD